MSWSGALRSPIELVTVGDFDPGGDQAIEYDFIGRRIDGRYMVQAHIGGGGMADVFRATDEQLGVGVAIKLLKPRMASDELRARMVQEAQAAAQVRHANLVRVFSTGKLDGTAYIVMELLVGPNLEAYLREHREQRLGWQEALALLLPALEALHAIHERGYVHRDIKPGNILITHAPGCPPTALVIDLGLVKADRTLRSAEGPPTTEVGRLLCTPSYTSPEQAAGLPVDRRSDVYSMAVTLYRVLAGRLPFHDARGKPYMVVLDKHIHDEPTRLAEAAVGAEISPAIASVIESGLRKNPNDRPLTMLAFAEALRAAVASAVPNAVPGVMPHRRRPLELLLALQLGLGGGVIGTLLVTSRSAGLPPAASLASDQTQGSDSAATRDRGESSPTVTGRTVSDSSAASPDSNGSPAASAGTALQTFGDSELTPAVPTSQQIIREPERLASTNAPRTRESPTLKAAWHGALALRTPDVQRCADQATGGLERLAAAVNIDPAGRVSAHVKGAPNTPLSRCLDAALRQTPLPAPRAPASFIHVFQLRVTPSPP